MNGGRIIRICFQSLISSQIDSTAVTWSVSYRTVRWEFSAIASWNSFSSVSSAFVFSASSSHSKSWRTARLSQPNKRRTNSSRLVGRFLRRPSSWPSRHDTQALLTLLESDVLTNNGVEISQIEIGTAVLHQIVPDGTGRNLLLFVGTVTDRVQSEFNWVD
jgi:hypothetical protein